MWHEDAFGCFDRRAAHAAFGPFVRFGGGKPDLPKPGGQLTGNMKFVQKNLYPAIARGLSGAGFGSKAWWDKREGDAKKSLDTAFDISGRELEGSIHRLVLPGDTRAAEAMRSGLSQAKATGHDTLRRTFAFEKGEDRRLALGLAGNALSREFNLASQMGQMYNQGMTQMQNVDARMGTFGTNLWGGIGEGVGSLGFAMQMGGR